MLDVWINTILKRLGKKHISQWHILFITQGRKLKIEDFPYVIQYAVEEAHKSSNIIKAFRVAGTEYIKRTKKSSP